MLLHLKFGRKKTHFEGLSILGGGVEILDHPAQLTATPAGIQPKLIAPPARSAPSGSPRIKTYTAPSIGKAMLLARQELGDDAILIQSKPLAAVGDSGIRYEVTFGAIPPGLAGEVPISLDQPACPTATPETNEVALALSSIRRELATLQSMLLQSGNIHPATPAVHPSLAQFHATLLRHDFDRELAMEIVNSVETGLTSGRDDTSEDAKKSLFTEELRARLPVNFPTDSADRPMLLIGPAASGKTTVLLKLALELGVRRGRNVEILSLERRKPDANRLLETMSGVLGINFRALSSIDALPAALDRPRTNTLVLIDTPGYSAELVESETELARFLGERREIEVHLTLSAAWHSSAIRQAVDRFELFQPAHLLFTMLDQAAALGPIVQESLRTGKSLSFLNSGSLGSGLLERASVESLVSRIWEPARNSAD